MTTWPIQRYSRDTDPVLRALEHLRRDPTMTLVRLQGGLWTTTTTSTIRDTTWARPMPSWSIRTSTVLALEAQGFLRESGSANGHPSYRLTTKGKRGKIRL